LDCRTTYPFTSAKKKAGAGEGAEYCVAFDLTGFHIDQAMASVRNWPQQPYFLHEAVSQRIEAVLAISTILHFNRASLDEVSWKTVEQLSIYRRE
jgi:hypothetical protein